VKRLRQHPQRTYLLGQTIWSLTIYEEIAIRQKSMISCHANRLPEKRFICLRRHPLEDVREVELRNAIIREPREVMLTTVRYDLNAVDPVSDNLEILFPQIWGKVFLTKVVPEQDV
jgi:hypothetical protein